MFDCWQPRIFNLLIEGRGAFSAFLACKQTNKLEELMKIGSCKVDINLDVVNNKFIFSCDEVNHSLPDKRNNLWRLLDTSWQKLGISIYEVVLYIHLFKVEISRIKNVEYLTLFLQNETIFLIAITNPRNRGRAGSHAN